MGSDVDGLAERLRAARSEIGMSQTQMADACGSTLSSWQNYERGKSTPGSKVIEKMILNGFSANWLLAGVGPMKMGDCSVTSEPERLDQDLLATIIEAVEEEAAEQGVDLSPAKKAEIIAMAYRHFAADQEHDPQLVARLFKLAS